MWRAFSLQGNDFSTGTLANCRCPEPSTVRSREWRAELQDTGWMDRFIAFVHSSVRNCSLGGTSVPPVNRPEFLAMAMPVSEQPSAKDPVNHVPDLGFLSQEPVDRSETSQGWKREICSNVLYRPVSLSFERRFLSPQERQNPLLMVLGQRTEY